MLNLNLKMKSLYTIKIFYLLAKSFKNCKSLVGTGIFNALLHWDDEWVVEHCYVNSNIVSCYDIVMQPNDCAVLSSINTIHSYAFSTFMASLKIYTWVRYCQANYIARARRDTCMVLNLNKI